MALRCMSIFSDEDAKNKGPEVSRPAGYPDGPLLRTGLAELPHPAPDRSGRSGFLFHDPCSEK